MVRQFALNTRSRFDRITLQIEPLENRDVPSAGMEDVLSLPHLAGMSDAYPIDPIHVALPPAETISSQGAIGKPLLKQQRDRFAVGSGAGQSTTINVYDAQTNSLLGILTPYGRDFTGGARVVTADVTGDGVQDIIVAPGAGSQSWVKVYDGTNLQEVRSFLAYTADFTGGIFVAVGDVDHDGRNDIVTGAGENGGPHVKVFGGADLFPNGDVTLAVLPYARRSFFAYESDFRGGVSVAVADVNGDGYADIITGAGHGGGPRVTVVSGKDQSILQNYFAYDPSMRSGIMVAAGDINGNGRAEIVTAPMNGGSPDIRVFEDTHQVKGYTPFNTTDRTGAGVALRDLDADGKLELIVTSGAGAKPQVIVLNSSGQTVRDFPAFTADYLGGLFVG